jgi:hypothetical protein
MPASVAVVEDVPVTEKKLGYVESETNLVYRLTSHQNTEFPKQNLVIGGYSSCDWTQHKDGDGSGGDSKCFVFNLTQNLRLQALSTVADKFTFWTPMKRVRPSSSSGARSLSSAPTSKQFSLTSATRITTRFAATTRLDLSSLRTKYSPPSVLRYGCSRRRCRT